MTVSILAGDCRELLKNLPDESVHCVVTSPPYWGLRDYGVTGQLGLETTPGEYVENMVAVFREVRRVLRADGTLWLNMGDSYATNGGAGYQGKNGTRADRRFTQESLRHRLNRETRNRPSDVLKPKDLVGMPWRLAFALQEDGWWLRQDIIWSKPNPMPESVLDRCTKAHEYLFLLAKSERYYFDSEAISEPASHGHEYIWDNGENGHGGGESHAGQGSSTRKFKKGIAGWADPESSRSEDHTAIGLSVEGRTTHAMHVQRSGNKARKPASARGVPMRKDQTTHAGMSIQSGFASKVSHHPKNGAVAGSVPWEGVTRNKRSVWTVTTQPFKDAHFATFPPALIEPCILAGCPAAVCSSCGAPHVRELKVDYEKNRPSAGDDPRSRDEDRLSEARSVYESNGWRGNNLRRVSETTGWGASCKCSAAPAACGVVLDPFGGAGTTGLVADRLQRDAILIELNPEYLKMATARITGDAPLFAEVVT